MATTTINLRHRVTGDTIFTATVDTDGDRWDPRWLAVNAALDARVGLTLVACADVIPRVERLDARILEILDTKRGRLEMDNFHHAEICDCDADDEPDAAGHSDICTSTHCRAGWAIHLAGPDGYALDRVVGPEIAGQLIYLASTGSAPDFYTSEWDAIEDMQEGAAIAAIAAAAAADTERSPVP